jgi:peptidoglycan/xylan/chitin deacetylase (PgdA/CDA1 family)
MGGRRVMSGVEHGGWKKSMTRGTGRGKVRGEDLERTVDLAGGNSPPEQGGSALDETMPVQRRPADTDNALDETMLVQRQAADADTPRRGTAALSRWGSWARPPQADAEGGDSLDGAVGDDAGIGVPGTRFSRRVLFAAGGLVVLGGCGVAAASRLSSSGSANSASASPTGAAPSTSHSPRPRAAVPPPATPGDLSSSSARPSPTQPASGAGLTPTEPQFYVHNGPKAIALTLDDGPNRQFTPQMLALLARYGIQATFCMIGRQIAQNQSLVSEVVAAGHTVVNHTWDHADQTKLSMAAIRSEISRTNDALAAVGVHPSIFRAPYGAWSPTVLRACAAARLRPLDWSVDPRDWSRPGTSTIVARIMSHTRTGSIILEHDGGGDRSQTVAALKIVLPRLLDEGYHFTGV